jgi:hypothetical protein
MNSKNSIRIAGALCLALSITLGAYAQVTAPTPTTKNGTKTTTTTPTPANGPNHGTVKTSKPTTNPTGQNTSPSKNVTPATTTPTPATTASTGTTTGNTTSGSELKLVKQTLVYNSGKVYLNWVVPGNSPDCIYVIERSLDGTEFEPMGLKEGIQSPLELLYSWVDTKPMEGTAHYRIKRVNNDGDVTALGTSTSVNTPAPSPLIQDKTGRVAFVK